MKDQISGSRLLKRLGMAYECKDCPNSIGNLLCGLGTEMMEVCDVITQLMEEDDDEQKNECESRNYWRERALSFERTIVKLMKVINGEEEDG